MIEEYAIDDDDDGAGCCADDNTFNDLGINSSSSSSNPIAAEYGRRDWWAADGSFNDDALGTTTVNTFNDVITGSGSVADDDRLDWWNDVINVSPATSHAPHNDSTAQRTVFRPTAPETPGAAISDVQRKFWAPWFPAPADQFSSIDGHDSYLVQTQMKSRVGEGLLVDPGAHDDLVSDGWAKRFTQECDAAGVQRPRYLKLNKPVDVGGVGNGKQTATKAAICRLGVDGKVDEFEAPMLPNSNIPALLGCAAFGSKECCWIVSLARCFASALAVTN